MERIARPAVSAVLVVAVTVLLGFGAGVGLLDARHVAQASPNRDAETSALPAPSEVSSSSTAMPSVGSGTLVRGTPSRTDASTMSMAEASTAGADSMTMAGTPPACQGDTVVGAMVTPFWQHFKSAHLERSPGDQVSDLLNVSQYTKTHTVLFEHMLGPLVDVVIAAPSGFQPFWQHFKSAHLERSPSDQVSDLLNVSQYTKTHTVLFEHMLAPGLNAVTDAGC